MKNCASSNPTSVKLPVDGFVQSMMGRDGQVTKTQRSMYGVTQETEQPPEEENSW